MHENAFFFSCIGDEINGIKLEETFDKDEDISAASRDEESEFETNTASDNNAA